MTRRHRQSEEPAGGNWLTTYADMITLVLAFFVLLFSMSTIDVKRFDLAVTSMQKALGFMPGGRTVFVEDLQDAGELKRLEQVRTLEFLQLAEIRRNVEDALIASGRGGEASFSMEERGLVIRFADSVLFPSSRAVLTPEAREVMDDVAGILRRLGNHIRIEGHTDSRPINTPQFPSNWELSTARATTVLRYLLEVHGLSASRLSAAGYGEYRPVASNETPEGMQQNRRVDIVILRFTAGGEEPD